LTDCTPWPSFSIGTGRVGSAAFPAPKLNSEKIANKAEVIILLYLFIFISNHNYVDCNLFFADLFIDHII
jgi:hypothetical protein